MIVASFYSLETEGGSAMRPTALDAVRSGAGGLVVADSFRKLRCSPTSFAL